MPLPSNIQNAFDAALTEYLAAERQHLTAFLVDIAGLCNRHGTQESIQALRSFAGVSIPKPCPKSPMLDVATTPRGEELFRGTSSITSATVSQSMAFAPRKTRPSTNTTFTTFSQAEGDGITVPTNVADDFAVNRLAFIEANGEIHSEMPISDRIFGPRFAAVKGRFLYSLSNWRPHNEHLRHFADSFVFHVTSAAVILANFVFMVVLTDWKVNNVGATVPGSFTALGYCFMGFYVLELTIHVAALGGEFFTGKEAGWNIFDLVIVVLGLFELAVNLAGASFVNTSFLRVLRFARVSRLLRMFSAMRLFKEIKIMVDCLAGSFIIFIFCMAVFTMLLAMFSIFFVQGASSYLEEASPDSDPIVLSDLKASFGSVWDCMRSLFFSAAMGEALIYYNLAVVLGDEYNALFLFFLAFYHFSFFNVIVGVFCEKALHLTQPTTDELMHQRYEKEFQDARELYALLRKCIDHRDSVEAIDKQRFEEFVSHPEVERYLTVRGLKHSSAIRFFRVLCEVNQSSSISFPDFVSALVKLDGFAASIDQHVMSVRQLHGLHQLQAMQRYQHNDIKHVTSQLHKDLENQLTKISNLIDDKDEKTLTSIRRMSISEGNIVLPPASLTEDPSITFVEDGTNDGKKTNMTPATAHETRFASEDVHAIRSLLLKLGDEISQMKSSQSKFHEDLKGSQVDKESSRESKDLTFLDMKTQTNSEAMIAHSHSAVEDANRRVADMMLQLEAQKRFANELQLGMARQQQEADQAVQDVMDKAEAREAKLKEIVQSQSRQLFKMTHKSLQGVGAPPITGADNAGFGSIISCAVPRACSGKWTPAQPSSPSRIGNDVLETTPQLTRSSSGLHTNV